MLQHWYKKLGHTNFTEVIVVTKVNKNNVDTQMLNKEKREFIEDKDGIQAVQNQLMESYQSGVVEDELQNNIGIHHFNNRKA